MPLASAVATQLTTPETRSASLFIGGRDLTNLMDLDATTIKDSGSSARSTANLRLRTTLAAVPEIYDQARVDLIDHDADVLFFTGYVRSRHPTTEINPMLELIADDIGGIIDDTWIVSEARPAETMQARIGYLWGYFSGRHLSDDLSYVASIGGVLAAATFEGMTLRQALEATMAQASASAAYYIDPLGKLHVFTAESNDAPYDVKVGTPAGGEIAPEDLDIDFDSNSYANRVYIRGATPSASAFLTDFAAVAAANGLVRTRVIDAPESESSAMTTSLAFMYLGRVSVSIARGVFTTSSPYDGWRAGQNVTVTEPDMGLAAEEFRLVAVTTRFRKMRVGFTRHYTIEFGGARGGGYQ